MPHFVSQVFEKQIVSLGKKKRKNNCKNSMKILSKSSKNKE